MKHFVLVAVCAILVASTFANEASTHSTAYNPPKPSGPDVVFVEPFDNSWTQRWVVTENEEFQGTWSVGQGLEAPGISGDQGLIVGDVARKHGISAVLPRVIQGGDEKDLVVQYEVKLQKALDCGGAYLKLLTASDSFDQKAFSGATPYTIMFGPDKCGSTNKVHFIFRHKNPITGEYEEKHLDNPPSIKSDRSTHLYTLHVKPDNTFEIFIDQTSVRSGSLLEDFLPPVNPPKEIDDPTDIKPADWVDEAQIPDPEATKPEDWDEDAPMQIVDPDDHKPATWLDDEPEYVADPSAKKPDEWDEDFDGDWEAPQVPNPKCEEFGCGEWKPRTIRNPNYKGKWSAPLIDNPAYIGEWKPRQIPNPKYFEDLHPHRFSPIGAVGIELWTMTNEMMFDNIFVGHSLQAAEQYGKDTWKVKFAEEEARRKVEEEADQQGLLEGWIEQFSELARTNPLLLAGSAAAGILPLLFCCCWPSSRGRPAAETSSTSTSERSENQRTERTDDSDDAKPQAIPEKKEGEAAASSPSKRKRTAKVQ